MTKKKRGSSSVYRTGTDSVKIRLMVLTVLAALLLLTALCAKYICPYDPYEQNLLLASSRRGRSICWEQTAMDGICFPGF